MSKKSLTKAVSPPTNTPESLPNALGTYSSRIRVIASTAASLDSSDASPANGMRTSVMLPSFARDGRLWLPECRVVRHRGLERLDPFGDRGVGRGTGDHDVRGGLLADFGELFDQDVEGILGLDAVG